MKYLITSMLIMLASSLFAQDNATLEMVLGGKFKEQAQIEVRQAGSDAFPLVDGSVCPIIVSKADGKTVKKVALLFAEDVERVTGLEPRVITTTKPNGKYVVVIGTIEGNDYLKELGKAGKIDFHALEGAWERYIVKVVDNPSKGVDKALVIAGSDRRGAAYGAFAVSEAIGVSPWYWWADFPVEKKEKLLITADIVSKSPSIKYRGIFIND